jgi:hypothetical protein
MQRQALALAFALTVLGGAALVAVAERRHPEGVSEGAGAPAQDATAMPDVFTARVEARDYLRNPDGTARIVFTNATSTAVDVTLCGSKNRQEAASRFGETGPLEVRVGADIGTDTAVVGSVMRNQPFFALHFRVPGGSPEKPTHAFIWNGDRDRAADLQWRLLVGSSR